MEKVEYSKRSWVTWPSYKGDAKRLNNAVNNALKKYYEALSVLGEDERKDVEKANGWVINEMLDMQKKTMSDELINFDEVLKIWNKATFGEEDPKGSGGSASYEALSVLGEDERKDVEKANGFLRYGTRPLLEMRIRREVEALHVRKTMSEQAMLHDQQTTQTFLGPPDAYFIIPECLLPIQYGVFFKRKVDEANEAIDKVDEVKGNWLLWPSFKQEAERANDAINIALEKFNELMSILGDDERKDFDMADIDEIKDLQEQIMTDGLMYFKESLKLWNESASLKQKQKGRGSTAC
ncbi:uncharacterized protein LOC113282339 [Papaver somniferum]|uniref:uncharacterized protein LOC113282339 n=1 Tax=Papaver somniferum TaxID=3469 RepID=UPI000E6F7485|nr:uncharacterized protein LOC113282339 [Papaver somniferum]